MTQKNEQTRPSTATVSAMLAFSGFLLLSAGVFFMTRLATQYAAVPAQQSDHPPPVHTPLSPLPVDTAPHPGSVADTPENQAPANSTPDTSAAETGAVKPETAATAPTKPETSESSTGAWVISFNPDTNTPDDAGVKLIEEIGEALAADPTASLSLVGVNHFRRSSKRALAAAQSIQERLRAINPAFPRRINTSAEQTAETDGLSVRATLAKGGK